MRLEGKVAVITGAGRGIGRATVARFLDEGARVVAADLDAGSCADLGEDPRVEVVAGDVSVRADAERVVAAATRRFGRLDILVNNAGIVDRLLPVGEVTDELWARVLAVNLTAPMLLARAALPHLIASQGVIVNIASVGGLFGSRGGAAYAASKHGLIGLTRNIAATYATDGVRAVAIAPGGVNTGISIGGEPSARGLEALKRSLATSVRMAEPSEIASVIAFVASSEASFVSGEVLVADAAWTAY